MNTEQPTGPVLHSMALSPLQEGMLFHHLHAPHSGVDIEQVVCALTELVDVQALRSSWSRIADRHEVLRASFHWENLDPAIQKVQGHVDIPFDFRDMTNVPAADQETALRAYLASDRASGFIMDKAPLARVALLRFSNADYRMVWTFHHAILDGRSMPIVLREVFNIYDGIRRGVDVPLAEVRPFSSYIDWRLGLDVKPAKEFWKRTLSGFESATPIPAMEGVGQGEHQEQEIRLPWGTTNSLRAVCENEGFTLNSTVQGAWALLLARYSAVKDVVFGVVRAGRSFAADSSSMVGMFINTLPLRVSIQDDAPVFSWLRQVRESQKAVREFEYLPLSTIQSVSDVPRGTPLFESVLVFENNLLNSKMKSEGVDWTHREAHLLERTNYPITLYGYAEPELILRIAYETGSLGSAAVKRMLGHLKTILEGIASGGDLQVRDLPMLTCEEAQQILETWNQTQVDFPREKRIHELIEEQVKRSPDAIAVVFNDQRVSYRELDARASQLARFIQAQGIGAEDRIGICMSRSVDMMVALLAALKSGGAYVPLDPTYPAERVNHILSDAQVRVILTEEILKPRVTDYGARVVAIDTEWNAISKCSWSLVQNQSPEDGLAYVIYTSGSTGRPKGVMVTHSNVVNFFTAMSAKLGVDGTGVWLAVTSISFDISVLELLWTLSQGFRVVLQENQLAQSPADPQSVERKPVDFSLFYFASDEAQSGNKYQLLVDGARFADEHGFAAIWTPERHFHAFGGLFPNPAVTGAALAMVTRHLQIRAGSVVLPLHDPIRVAEEWAVVDHLSGGRVGLSAASGWHDQDFILASDNYSDRKNIMMRDLETVRNLWRGGSITRRNGSGKDVTVRIFPPPIQPELPVWITAGGDPGTFRLAGEAGANLLTHLLGQTVEELEAKIKIYRGAFESKEGKSRRGQVTLMLHTFVGSRDEDVADVVRTPFCNYLKSSISLMKQVAKGLGEEFAGTDLGEQDLAALIDHAFDRYFRSSGLFGSPETCLSMVRKLQEIGVDEIGCLVDFGIESETVMANLENLSRLLKLSRQSEQARSASIPEQIVEHKVTHLQCTPSLARLLTSSPEGRTALGSLKTLLVGGEALSRSLAGDLLKVLPGKIWNMYGPTETTVWSTMSEVEPVPGDVSIGRPIANTRVFVLDDNRRPVPVGVPGELYIGGDGIARGYLNQPSLTAEKFVNVSACGRESRTYRTGDLVRYSPEGSLDFLGRMDHQVKIRGHRIELGEIETALMLYGGIRQTVVTAVEDTTGERVLCAYLTCNTNSAPPATELRRFLGSKLPGYMIPGIFIVLDSLPLTPNGKIDRNRLPMPDISRPDAQEFVGARDPFEELLTKIWEDVLKVSPIGVRDNYFDLGGHSLLAVRLFSEVKKAFGIELPLATFYSAPTIESCAKVLRQNGQSDLWSALVPIQQGGSRRPFYFIPGVGGGVLVFRDVTLDLGPDQPVYVLQPTRLVGKKLYPTSIEEMAARYIKEIQAVQPLGPYYIGGYSLGGFIAFEMAQQLSSAGHKIALLALFDAHAPLRIAPYRAIPLSRRATGSRLVRLAEVLASRDRFAIIKRRFEKYRMRLREKLAGKLDRPLPAELMTLEGSQIFAGENYIARPYPGCITLFRPTERPGNEPWSYELGWENVAASVEVQEVPGDHLSIFSGTDTSVLSGKLRSCLDRFPPNCSADGVKQELETRTA